MLPYFILLQLSQRSALPLADSSHDTIENGKITKVGIRSLQPGVEAETALGCPMFLFFT